MPDRRGACLPVDRLRIAAYRAAMATPDSRQKLDHLTAQLDALGEVLARLLDENRSLRQQQEQLFGERRRPDRRARLGRGQQAPTSGDSRRSRRRHRGD